MKIFITFVRACHDLSARSYNFVMADLKLYDIFDINPLRDYILSRGKPVVLKRNSNFCEFGKPANDIGVVTSGAVAFNCPDSKGDMQTLSLAFKGEIAGAYVSLYPSRCSAFDVTALCTTELSVLPIKDMVRYMDEELPAGFHVEFAKAVAYGFLMRATAYRCQSPEERYRELLQRNPELASTTDIPMRAIAAYLGITRETFARMRTRMKEK